MTFDDDFVQVKFDGGRKRFRCSQLGLDWPPPKFITVAGLEFKRVSVSTITDEQRSAMTHVCRGALYEPVKS